MRNIKRLDFLLELTKVDLTERDRYDMIDFKRGQLSSRTGEIPVQNCAAVESADGAAARKTERARPSGTQKRPVRKRTMETWMTVSFFCVVLEQGLENKWEMEEIR